MAHLVLAVTWFTAVVSVCLHAPALVLISVSLLMISKSLNSCGPQGLDKALDTSDLSPNKSQCFQRTDRGPGILVLLPSSNLWPRGMPFLEQD